MPDYTCLVIELIRIPPFQKVTSLMDTPVRTVDKMITTIIKKTENKNAPAVFAIKVLFSKLNFK